MLLIGSIPDQLEVNSKRSMMEINSSGEGTENRLKDSIILQLPFDVYLMGSRKFTMNPPGA